MSIFGLGIWLLIKTILAHSEYYSFNGTGNNLSNPHWGSTNSPYIRLKKIRQLTIKDLSSLISPRNLSNFLSYGETATAREHEGRAGRMTLLGLS